MATTTNLALTLLEAAQSQKDVTINTALRRIDIMSGAQVIDQDLDTPPGSPSTGDLYIVAATGTGDWTGHDGDLAFYVNSTWYFIDPVEGMRVFVEDEGTFYMFDGTNWTPERPKQGRLWISATVITPIAGSEAAGAYAAAEITAGKPNLRAVSFDNSGVSRAQFNIRPPEDWNLGGMYAKVYWLTQDATGGTCRWQVTAVTIGDNEQLDADYAPATNIDDVSNGADDLNITASTLVTVGGTIATDDFLEFQVSREYDTVNDTINATVYLVGIELTYDRATL